MPVLCFTSKDMDPNETCGTKRQLKGQQQQQSSHERAPGGYEPLNYDPWLQATYSQKSPGRRAGWPAYGWLAAPVVSNSKAMAATQRTPMGECKGEDADQDSTSTTVLASTNTPRQKCGLTKSTVLLHCRDRGKTERLALPNQHCFQIFL